MKFVDEISIAVSSGHGGPGKVSFFRASGVPRGGPDGGDGGRGGHVIFRVNPQLNTLIDFRFRKKFSAEEGQSGGQADMTGKNGGDLILEVPPGTVVRSSVDNSVLVDLSTVGDFLFLKGGRGGKGNTFFKTSVNQAPTQAQPGEPGEARDIHLELKLIADVGVIGFPNAGKSTFISRISAAKPKIADYPFTTLSPNLGVVRVDVERSFVVADIPGLVPGAHLGVGLGTQFLRHVERTSVFVHLIDASGISGRDPLQDFHDINHELSEYDKLKGEDQEYQPLSQRRQIVVLNKIDVLADEQRIEIKNRFRKIGIETLMISAVSGQGLKELIFQLGELVTKNRNTERELHP